MNLRRFTFGVLLVCLCNGPAIYGQSLKKLPIQGNFKGGLIDASSTILYITDYDQDKLVKIDLNTNAVVAELAVGDGPTSLKLSDSGKYLACINRLDKNVSIVELSTFRVTANPDTGAGPSAITAIDGGGFAITNAFEDSLLFIDETSGESSGELTGFNGVPVSVASSGIHLAVAVRESNEIVLFDKSSTEPSTTVPLNSPPRKIVSLGEGRFLVDLLSSEPVVVTAATGTLEPYTGQTGVSYDQAADGLIVKGENSVYRLNNQFEIVNTFSTDQAANAVFSDGALIAIALVSGDLLVHNPNEPKDASSTLDKSKVAVEVEDEGVKPAIEKESETPPRPASPPVESKKARNVARKKQEPREELEKPAEQKEIPGEPEAKPKKKRNFARKKLDDREEPSKPEEPRQKKAKRKAKEEEPREKIGLKERFFPPASTGSRAKPSRASIMGLRPRAPELSDQSEGDFRTTLSKALGITAPGSLLNLDWQEVEVVNSDDIEFKFETGQVTIDGDVEFKIGEADGASDHILIDEEQRRILLRGNVDVSTETSTLTADHFEIEAGKEIELSDPVSKWGAPLVPVGWQAPPSRSSFEKGIFLADNLSLDEPERHLEAEHIEYDMELSVGEFRGTKGRVGPIFFNADALRILGPADAEGKEVWVTTCDHEDPHYRIRMETVAIQDGNVVFGENARFQLFHLNTPFFIPKIGGLDLSQEHPLNVEFDIGRRAELGNFLNVAQWYQLSPNVEGAIRVFATSQEGVGFGVDSKYDFMDDPTSPWFRSKGELQTMYTTEKRGYTQWYHRQELSPRTVLLGQWEQWYDRNFVKDFYNDIYEDRSGPRSFVNLTHTKNAQIFGLTASKATHDFTTESEKLPELTYHMLERRLLDNFYFSYDAAAGYYQRVPDDLDSARVHQAARLSYDWNVKPGFNILPFAELDATWYSRVLSDNDPETRGTGTAGVVVQSRFQRSFKGKWGFSGFKHIVVPSVTLSYRPKGSIDPEDVPRFDDFDDRPARSRLETKVDNYILGRDAETGEVWAVARLAGYFGQDFWNESDDTTDYEIDVSVRPRPQWGIRTIAERHDVNVEPGDAGDELSRVLAFVFYENDYMKNPWNGRLGFAYTDVGSMTINREVLYGAGYRINQNWAVSADHRYDLEADRISRQSYQIRRRLHRWEMGLRIRERDSGLDIGLEFSLIDFAGAKIRF